MVTFTMDKVKIAKRLAAMILVGGVMLYLLYEPTEGNLVNEILEILSKRVLSNLGGVEL